MPEAARSYSYHDVIPAKAGTSVSKPRSPINRGFRFRGTDPVGLQRQEGGFIAPVMIATASDMEKSFGLITAMRLPSRWIWMRSATSNT